MGTYLVKLNQKDLSSRDSHDLSIMLTASEISSGFPTMRSIFWEQPGSLDQKKLAFSDEALAELKCSLSGSQDIVKTAVTVFEEKIRSGGKSGTSGGGHRPSSIRS